MLLGRFDKQPQENQLYAIDYTEFLTDTDPVPATAVESVSNIVVEPNTAPDALSVGPVSIPSGNDKSIQFRVSGGLDGTEYKVTFLTKFDTAEEREDEVIFRVEDR